VGEEPFKLEKYDYTSSTDGLLKAWSEVDASEMTPFLQDL
jgi:hypothetical protein